jgi:hypothetical protein
MLQAEGSSIDLPTTATHLTLVGSSYNLFYGSHVFDNRAQPLSGVKKENMIGVKKKNMIQESREKARRTWILVLVSLAAFMVALDALVFVQAQAKESETRKNEASGALEHSPR